MPLFSLKTEAFGLDISDFSLKIAKLKKRKKRINLVSFGEEKIPTGIIEQGEVKNEKALAEIIKQALKKVKGEKLKTNYCISSLPEEKSFLDLFQIPLMSEEEIKEAVRFEIENHIPLSLDEVYFDFEKVQPVFDKIKYQEVLIAVVPKKIVESYTQALKRAGLQPRALEIECLAIVRALIKKGKVTGPLLIIDFGESRTTFSIYSGKSLRFTSTTLFSSQKLTEFLSKKLALSQKEAEELKKREGLIGEKRISQVLIDNLNKLVQDIKNYLQYYRSHESKDQILHNGKQLEKIILCGGGANLKGLVNFLHSRLKIEVELGNPWVNILQEPLKEVPNLPFEKSLGYTTALGLALRGIQES